MKEGENVVVYFARTLIIANKMKIHGENIQQVVIIEKILRSMTSRVNVHGGDEQALKVTYNDRIGGRGGSRARGAFQGRGRQTFSKDITECYKCHQLEHFQYERPKWEKEVNYAELEEKEEMLLMSYVELNQSRREDLRNNSKMAVLGKGNIRLQIVGVTQIWTSKFQGLRTLQHKQIVRGLPQLKAPSKICTDYMVGEQHRDAIPKRVYGEHHKDCNWYMLTSTDTSNLFYNSKKRYFISFIDDYSCKIGVESSPLMSSMSFAKLMALVGSSLQPTFPNKME
ncbi:hypothetical protein CK203_071022 [Vitis vinifera]|uniref:Retrovirus-related Pol polyprotein from transposon TNT 1-94 n=1 Tax=Vitis vinifera TaxID=29760 RepID=A0A438E984_VITVI|nr:hypothetical protein CK203_071022 [Vitis vinifera]